MNFVVFSSSLNFENLLMNCSTTDSKMSKVAHEGIDGLLCYPLGDH